MFLPIHRCELSKSFLPKFERLADAFNVAGGAVRLASADCTKTAPLCAEQKAEANEVFLFVKEDGGKRHKFNGVRSVEGVSKFLIKLLGDHILDDLPVEQPESLAAINELTDETFTDHVAIGRHFVKFYAPWCGHCQRLAPAWDELASALEYDSTVSISKVDCTQFRPVCQEFEVKGYPTLLWIVDGKKVEKYTGARSLDDLKSYVDRMAGTKRTAGASNDEKVTATVVEGAAVLQLTADIFEHSISKGVTFVKFFAPWCGHCKRMSPTWDELAVKFVDDATVKIAKVDCTLANNKELCSEQEVNGFPTIFLYKDGEKLNEYSGSRQLDDLFDYVRRAADADKKDEL